ncbi:MAG: thioredoxin [Ignavibacteriae bacterium HGW-Ignavibacteriae-2]|jgi:thioredoxin-like negative regulator of GroEL|nr:MAG: thioredoxin [Ignavibacteriae bacterium HGW-Ignavibacteriae-2]
MVETVIESIDELEKFKNSHPISVVYFSTPECNVCKVLKPKLIELLDDDFSKVKFGYVDLNKSREIAGQNTIFTVPTIIFYFEGIETIRESRNISLPELYEKLDRPYKMLF